MNYLINYNLFVFFSLINRPERNSRPKIFRNFSSFKGSFFFNPGETHFVLTSPLGSRKSAGLTPRYYPTKTQSGEKHPEGGAYAGVFNLHFNFLLSQNQQVHPRKIPVFFLPLFILRETILICYQRFCLLRKICEFPGRERMSGIPNSVNRSYVFLSRRSSTFFLF